MQPEPNTRYVAHFRIFRSAWSSWADLFQEAANFVTELGPEWVISISHSADETEGVVTVWYWAAEPAMEPGE